MRIRFLALAAVLALAGCGGRDNGQGSAATTGSQTVSRADFGEEWPLTVDSGVLSCEGAGSVYFTADDGRRYAVNGTAMTAGDAQRIDAIWADDPTGLSPKKNIGPLIDDGLKLCED